MALAWGYQRVLAINPYVVLNIALPIVLGVLLGLTSIAALRIGHVRNRRVAWTVAIAVALVGYACAWFRSFGWPEVAVSEFAAAFARTLENGGPIPEGSTRMPASLLLLGWIYEIVVVLSVAIAIPIAWWRRAVFCEGEQRFVRRRKVRVAYGPGPLAVREAAQRNGIDGVLDLNLHTVPENETEGELRFFLHETCLEKYLTVFWHGKLDGYRGNKVVRDVLVLRRVRVQEPFLDRLLA